MWTNSGSWTPDARLLERWRPDDERPEVLHDMVTWRPRADIAPLVIDVPLCFREVWGED